MGEVYHLAQETALLKRERTLRQRHPDIEISFRGHRFLTYTEGDVSVDGCDLQTDLINVSRLIGILSDVLDKGLTGSGEGCRPSGRS